MTNKNTHENKTFRILSAIGILFWLIFSKTITPAIKDNGLMVKIGKHTREVMCHHLFAVFLIQGIIYKIYQLLNIKSSFDIEAYMFLNHGKVLTLF